MSANKLFPLFSALVFAVTFGLWIQSSQSDTSVTAAASSGVVDDTLSDVVGAPVIADEKAEDPADVDVVVDPDELVITKAIIPKGHWGRHWERYMNPTFITIHSTQNWKANANAEGHAKLLLSGDKRSVSWHFTVDQDSVYQSVPTNEQARHSDRWGEGDKTSIGIEMCENWGNSRAKTLERTSKLVAHLMQEHDIPLNNVVPHNHWQITRWDGVKYGKKNCPHFLMDDGKVGKKWQLFLEQIKAELPLELIEKMERDAEIAEQKRKEAAIAKLEAEIAELQAEIAKKQAEIAKEGEGVIPNQKEEATETPVDTVIEVENEDEKAASSIPTTETVTTSTVSSEGE